MCFKPLNRAKDTMSPTTKPLDINTLLARSHAEYAKGSNLADLLQQVSQPPPLSKIGSQAIRRSDLRPSTHSKKHHKEKS
jgi:hypothetical protein